MTSWTLWQQPSEQPQPDTTVDDAFERISESILQAERSQHQKLQQDLLQALDLLHNAIRTLDPDVVDEQREQDPRFLDKLNLDGWAQLLHDAKRRGGDRWWRGAENPQLMEQLKQLQEENAQLLRNLGSAQRRVTALTLHVQEVEAKHERWRQANAPTPLHLPGEITLPPLQKSPPPDFREHCPEDNWERDSQFLAILALSGWSQQHSLVAEMASRLDISVNSGTFVRQLNRLSTAGLIRREPISVPFGRVNILRLTDLGKRLSDALNILSVESEWERLQRLRSASQVDHHALICHFSMAARQRNYRAQVCPSFETAETYPDLKVVSSRIEQSYVFVEMSENPAAERLEQWRAVAQIQGYVALCAVTMEARQSLLKRASAAGLTGRITDFESLRNHLPNALWAEQWPAAQPKSGD